MFEVHGTELDLQVELLTLCGFANWTGKMAEHASGW